MNKRSKAINYKAYIQLLLAVGFSGVNLQAYAPAMAKSSSQCQIQIPLTNTASYSYLSDDEIIQGFSPTVNASFSLENPSQIVATGIKNDSNNLVLGSAIGSLNDELLELGFTPAEATKSSVAVTIAWNKLPENPTINEIGNATKTAILETLPGKSDAVNSLNSSAEQIPLELTIRSFERTLLLAGLTRQEVERVYTKVSPTQKSNEAWEAMSQALPEKAEVIARTQQMWNAELENIRKGVKSRIQEGNEIAFTFQVNNPSNLASPLQIPSASTIQQKWLQGPGTVSGVKYQIVQGDNTASLETTVTEATDLTLPANGKAIVKVMVKVGKIPTAGAAITVKFSNNCTGDTVQETVVSSPPLAAALTDPSGKITSCTGGVLPDYNGFSVGLYEPDPNDLTGGIRGAVNLTGTEVPDIPGNNRPAGLAPNTENSNPFFLTNSDKGRYSFLLDKSKGQLVEGRSYILLVNPPQDSNYGQRRVRLVIGQTQTNGEGRQVVKYTATALDGLPISIVTNTGDPIPQDGRQTEGQFGTFVEAGEIVIEDADRQGLSIATISIGTSVCEAADIQITKTGDRAAAEPGDTVIYRLAIRNLTNADINKVAVTDILPFGFRLVNDSVRAEIGSQSVPITTTQNGSNVTFQAAGVTLPANGVMNVAYAVVLTPDAIRGNGENIANVNGQRVDNLLPVKDGPAIYKLRIRPGILTDTGTIIGRVFVDKNFDGEQQPGEPGVPNAVVLMDDGNRIVTDPNGLFSVANVLPGYRTGVLDLTSLPGYTLAPNLYFSERNSQSRLVHLEPGGLVRMNFGVTPASKEGK
ncbi:MAG: DUF11 domain-containing protein [Cyanosarcina radialis HA8281-LM2]|jgi:uncharacterized repeat protein (TIGR01451 family)|nr:DUF11 domain-containing protein [Cyanosarcina radialis HA8281-LM2]